MAKAARRPTRSDRPGCSTRTRTRAGWREFADQLAETTSSKGSAPDHARAVQSRRPSLFDLTEGDEEEITVPTLVMTGDRGTGPALEARPSS